MRLAVIVPVLDRASDIEASLIELQDWRRRGHVVIVADGGSRDDTVRRAHALADRVVSAPRGWGRQANAGARAPEAEHADALVFLPVGVRLPERADRLIARALSNSTSPWGRFDIRFECAHVRAHPLLRAAATLTNAGSRLTGICTREQVVFVARGAFLAMEGFGADEAAAETDFAQRACGLGEPIALQPPALVPTRAPSPASLLARAARREARRLALALGVPGAARSLARAVGA